MRGLAIAIFLVASSAAAQDLDYDPSILTNCMENAENTADRTYCIGQAAEACTQTEAGSSTVGLGYCYSEEWEQWDDRLNTAYQRLLITQAEVAKDNAAFNENIPGAVDSMRDMQRAWIGFRDAACEWEYIQWGGGTGGGPASAACMLRITAQQAIFLEGQVY